LLVAVLAVGGTFVVARTRPDRSAPAAASARAVTGTSAPRTLLVATVRAGDLSGQADTLALFSSGGGQSPYVLLIPTATLTEIPGFGFDIVGRALSFGRVPLEESTVENMLGVHIAGTVVFDDGDLASLVDRVGGIDVTVSQDLFSPDAQGRLVPAFTAGAHHFDGKSAVAYLIYQGQQETELSRLARQQQIWEALMTRFPASATSRLAAAVSAAGDALDGDVAASQAAAMFAALAALPAGARTYDDVPVESAGGGDTQAFKVSDDDLASQVSRFLAADRLWKGSGSPPRLQLLNGNGAPDGGVAVAEKLIPAGFHLVDNGNARNFDYAQTQIVVYASDSATLALAQQVKTLLGAGTVVVSATPQTSVDVTVVVGKDLRSS
jgi:LCP family protein required for cell wall assembly